MSGILTKAQLAASLTVLRMFLTPRCATVALTLPGDQVTVYIGLIRCGYLANINERKVQKLSAPFQWDTMQTTALGRRYLDQIDNAN